MPRAFLRSIEFSTPPFSSKISRHANQERFQPARDIAVKSKWSRGRNQEVSSAPNELSNVGSTLSLTEGVRER